MAEVEVLLSRINDVRSRERRVAVTAGLARVVALAIMLVGAFFVVDWLFSISRSGRLVLLLLMFGVLGHQVLMRVIREAARYLDDDTIALRVESRHHDLNGRLISTIQLAREHPGAYIGSPELIEALEQDTISFTRSMNFGDIISLKMMKRAAVVALVVVLVASAFGATKPEFMKALLARLALADEKYPTRSDIVELICSPPARKDDNGREVICVARGEPISVTAAVRGVQPDAGSVEFWVTADPGNVAAVEMPRGDEETRAGEAIRRYHGAIRQVMEPITFRVRVYDAVSRDLPVVVLARPAVSSVRVKYKYPDYTGLAERESDLGDVTALTGTEITIRATTNKKCRSGTLRVRKGDEFAESPMNLQTRTVKDDAGEREVSELSGGFTVEKDGDYSISIVDTDELANASPVRYRVEALGDTPPQVKVIKPGRDVTVVKFAAWPVKFQIRDDYGVANVRLGYLIQSPPGTEGGEMVATEPKYIDLGALPGGREVSGEKVFDLKGLNVEVDNTVVYWIEAADCRRAPAPNIGKSRQYRFMVIETDEKLRELYGATGDAVRNVKTVIDDQTKTRDQVRDVINFIRDMLRPGGN